jgi:hypothetical protein
MQLESNSQVVRRLIRDAYERLPSELRRNEPAPRGGGEAER